jgi:hydroxypyruvate isomerase
MKRIASQGDNSSIFTNHGETELQTRADSVSVAPYSSRMKINRRHFLSSSAAAISAAALSSNARSAEPGGIQMGLPDSVDPGYRIRNKGIRHTLMGWCWKPMDTLELARHAKHIGLIGIEGVDRKYYPALREMGLEISLVSSHGFASGPCNPRFREEVVAKLNEAIDVASDVGCKKVITFTGMKFEGMDPDRAARDCVDVWKTVLPHAEKKGITLVLEHLNSRDSSHPMKGHPGYFGDDVEFCIELIKRVGSSNFKLLFDIYHVSIMNGDVIRRFRMHKDLIGHVHTAGNPGRCELDSRQEICYPAVMRAVTEAGYHDFVAHEFIPTWSDPILALRHAAMVCDV